MATSVNNSPTPGPSFEGTPLGGSHAASVSYRERRAWIGEYFDRTAADAWKALTSDAPVSRVRATVRAGRDRMRHTLLTWLPPDLHGKRVLDAGCGTGTASIELAQRGAEVVAIDLSPTLVQHAQERAEEQGVYDIDFRSGERTHAHHRGAAHPHAHGDARRGEALPALRPFPVHRPGVRERVPQGARRRAGP